MRSEVVWSKNVNGNEHIETKKMGEYY